MNGYICVCVCMCVCVCVCVCVYIYIYIYISSVQSLSHVQLFVTPWTAACQASLFIISSWRLLRLMSIESVMPSYHLILCRPLLSSCPKSFPASGSFQMSHLFASGGQSIRVSASALVPPMDTQDWSPLGWTGWISWLSKGLSRVFSSATVQAAILQRSAFFVVQLSHPYMTTRKSIALTIQTFVSKVMSLLFNILSRLVIAFLPRSNGFSFHGCSHCLQWFWSPRIWNLTLFSLFPHLFAIKWWDQMPWSLFLECWVLSQLFHSPPSLSSRGS